MNARMPTPEGVIRNPPTATLVLASLVAGFAVNLLPWQGTALLVRPDFLLLVLLYWCVQEPRRIGATSAFFAGIVMDIAESSLTGQNALVYSLSAFLVTKLRLRILGFSWALQALHVFAVLMGGQALFVLEHFILDTPFPGAPYFLRSVVGAVLWPLLCWLLEIPRLQRRRDEMV